MQTLTCSIYKSTRKTNAYLFVPENTKLETLPAPLLQVLGKLEYVMNLSLNKKKKLAQADAHNVIHAINSQGYYLQLPEHHLPTSS